MIVCHNTFPLVLYIVLQRKLTTSLEKYPFFCYNRATKEENVAPEISPGIFISFRVSRLSGELIAILLYPWYTYNMKMTGGFT